VESADVVGHAGEAVAEGGEPVKLVEWGCHAYLDQPRHDGVGHKIDDAVFYGFLLGHSAILL